MDLQKAIEHGENIESRSALLQGSLLTGAAMLHAGLGLMHAIGNVTGGLYHELSHGLVLMRCMDAVLNFNNAKINPRPATQEDVRILVRQAFTIS